MRDEERRGGKLKVFLGFAPGVGKTYRMLQVAAAQQAQGVDVLVGVVETHARAETAALLTGLDVLPRRAVEYRGHTLEELDLDAALARKPQLILIDELAHSNVEGSRHGKRYQDVLDLLAEGIDVYTTVNVQHIESLNDVVAQITHVQVRETVPDTVLERADELELVDISPEQLLARLQEGKVYLPEQASRAVSHFFQRGNLLALRELALRRAAKHVDTDVQAYRKSHGVQSTWAVGERVLVSVGPSPASARLVRAGKRMASGLDAPWVAAYVEATQRPLREADRARLESNLQLAESLGATVVRLSGHDVAGPLLAYARLNNVTRVIVGKPTHARLLDRVRGSLLDDVVRASGDIDVHVISGSGERAPEVERKTSTPRERAPYLYATLLVALTSALGTLLRVELNLPDAEMLYLLAVMLAAFVWHRNAALWTATLSVVAYDFFFVPPYFTLAVRDGRYGLTFVMLFAVGTAISALATRLRRQEQDAVAREARTGALYSLSRSLGAVLQPEPAAEVVARHAADAFRAGAVVLLPGPEGLAPVASYPADLQLGPTERGVAKWTFEHARMAGLGTDTLPGSEAVCAPLRVGTEPLGVLALVPRDARTLNTDERSFYDALCNQAAFAFERARLADQARLAALRARSEELRNTLLSAVSHDLRTPLASITGAATTLRDAPQLSERDELLQTIVDEAERLERLVSNLLDMTRLQAGGMQPKRELVPVDELIGAALTRMERTLGARPIELDLESDLTVSVDPVLMQQVFVNLFENAAKYTPPNSPLELRARRDDQSVIIELIDQGPGLGSEPDRMFEKFHRAAPANTSGAGLGLAIARGIAEAHNATLTATNRPNGGALFTLRI
ncbi:MAG TPA: sensor histidine kinase KdpD [Polyangiales bacterium]|nr:sensor histidine kinase KdpD [Polyangiales bacterium]